MYPSVGLSQTGQRSGIETAVYSSISLAPFRVSALGRLLQLGYPESLCFNVLLHFATLIWFVLEIE